MSSILDALNKAEEERAAAEEALARGFDDIDAEDELTGRAAAQTARKQGASFSPFKFLALGLVFVVVVVAAAGGAALVVVNLRDGTNPLEGTVQSALVTAPEEAAGRETTPAPAAAESVERVVANDADETVVSTVEASTPAEDADPAPAKPSVTAEEAKPVSPGPATETGTGPAASGPADAVGRAAEVVVETPAVVESPETAPRPVLRSSEASNAGEAAPDLSAETYEGPPAPEPVQVAKAEPARPAVNASAPPPEAAPQSKDAPAPVESAQAPVPEPAQRAPSRVRPGEVDLMELPELSQSDKARHGLPEITVNIVSRPSKYRPEPSAMINYHRVTLNDTIPGTDAQLIGVSVHGIGIEVRGERFFVPK